LLLTLHEHVVESLEIERAKLNPEFLHKHLPEVRFKLFGLNRARCLVTVHLKEEVQPGSTAPRDMPQLRRCISPARVERISPQSLVFLPGEILPACAERIARISRRPGKRPCPFFNAMRNLPPARVVVHQNPGDRPPYFWRRSSRSLSAISRLFWAH
jgi:hypothetical protein